MIDPSVDVDFEIVAGCSAAGSSAGDGSGIVTGVVRGQSCAGEVTEPVTGTVSGCVIGSVMMILMLGSLGRVCGAHGADTALSAAGAGTVSTFAVPPQIAQHRATAAMAVPIRMMCFFIWLPPKF